MARQLLSVLFGWLLGILGSPLSDWVRRQWDRPRILKALRTELQYFQDTMASVAVSMKQRFEPLTHEYLRRMRLLVAETGTTEFSRHSLKPIDGFLEISAAVLAQAFAAESARPGAAAALRTYALPFLESQLHHLDLLSPASRGALLTIRQGMELFNQQVNDSAHYHAMTFSPGENYEAIVTNYRNAIRLAGRRAEILVEQIHDLLTKAEMRP
jgi:hypothetical protein